MKKIMAGFLILTLLLSLSACGSSPYRRDKNNTPVASEHFSGGSGREQDPYLISNAKDVRRLSLLACSEDWGYDNPYMTAFYQLTADVDLGGEANPWTPIGNSNKGRSGASFKGVFDGDGHTISGMYVYYDKDVPYNKWSHFGLFGEISGGYIKNLTISDSAIEVVGSKGSPIVGAVVGNAYESFIENCVVTNSVSLTAPYDIGGVVGSASDGNGEGEILRCSSAAKIHCTGSVGTIGGIVSYAGCPVRECVNTGSISGKEAAGIAFQAHCDITNCTNYGDIHALRSGAGIVVSFSNGALNESMVKDVHLSGCINEGRIEVENGDAGGIALKCAAVFVENCENKGDVSGTLSVGGIVGTCTCEPVFASAKGDAFIRGCKNTGSILPYGGKAGSLGGIAGHVLSAYTNVTVENCVNTGTVGSSEVLDGRTGGIIGDYSSAVSNGEGEMSVIIRNCENSGEVYGGGCGVGGIIGFANSSESNAHLLFTVDGCSNSGIVCFPALNGRGGGIVGEINCVNSYSEIINCSNAGDVIPNYQEIDDASRRYPWSCVLGGIVGHIGEGMLQYNPAENEPVTEGDPVARIQGCTNTGKVTAYEDTGIEFFADEICGRSDFPILIGS